MMSVAMQSSLSAVRAQAGRTQRQQQPRRGLAVVRAAPEEGPSTTANEAGTFFYKGKTYTEEEVRARIFYHTLLPILYL